MKQADLNIRDRCRSEWVSLIDEWIFDERDRKLLVRVLLDGVSLEKCADEIGLQRRQTQRRFDNAIIQLAKHTYRRKNDVKETQN